MRSFVILLWLLFVHGCGKVAQNQSNEPTSKSQPTEVADVSPNRSWWRGASVYHIWVRSFFDSDADGSGDIQGIIDRFSYIESLGTKALLLSPIFQSPSYHGYDVTDYYTINPNLGNLEQFRQLAEIAEKTGVKLILDIPLNHTSDQHPWFQKSIAGDEHYTDYYRWSDSLPEDYGFPWDEDSPPTAVWHTKANREGYFYGLFGYSNPDLNYREPKVAMEIKNVLRFWLQHGADGFRFDAARHFVEEGPNPLQADTESNHHLIAELIEFTKGIKPDAFIIGETYSSIEESVPYFAGKNSFDALFNFEFSSGIRDLYSESTIENVHQKKFDLSTKSGVQSIYTQLWNLRPEGKEFFVFLNSHDIQRFDSPLPMSDVAEKIIATLSVLSPFSTVVYYGEEIGLRQVSGYDHELQRGLMGWNEGKNLGFSDGETVWLDQRSWFPWKDNYSAWSEQYLTDVIQTSVSTQLYESSLLNHYRKLLHLKSSDAVFSEVEQIKFLDVGSKQLTIEYRNGEEVRYLVVNLSPFEFIEFEWDSEMKEPLRNVWSNKNLFNADALKLAPGETLILKN